MRRHSLSMSGGSERVYYKRPKATDFKSGACSPWAAGWVEGLTCTDSIVGDGGIVRDGWPLALISFILDSLDRNSSFCFTLSCSACNKTKFCFCFYPCFGSRLSMIGLWTSISMPTGCVVPICLHSILLFPIQRSWSSGAKQGRIPFLSPPLTFPGSHDSLRANRVF